MVPTVIHPDVSWIFGGTQKHLTVLVRCKPEDYCKTVQGMAYVRSIAQRQANKLHRALPVMALSWNGMHHLWAHWETVRPQ